MKVSNLLFGLTAFFAMQSYAASISQVDLSSAGSKVSGSYQYFTFHMYYSGAYEQTSIFDEILISESDVGSSISIGSNFTDPQYSNFIEKLTNDVDEELYVFYKVSDLNGRGGGGGNTFNPVPTAPPANSAPSANAGSTFKIDPNRSPSGKSLKSILGSFHGSRFHDCIYKSNSGLWVVSFLFVLSCKSVNFSYGPGVG